VALVRGLVALVHLGHHVLAAAVLHFGHLAVLFMSSSLLVLGMLRLRSGWSRSGRLGGGRGRRDDQRHHVQFS
jgi:hypothetical protein